MKHGALKPIRLLFAVLMLALAAVVVTPTGASAAPCVIDGYSAGATVSVQPPGPYTPGQQIQIIGTGFPPGCEVTITVDGVIVGTATTDANGAFSFGVTLGSTIGTVTIGVSAGSFTRDLSIQVGTAATTATTTPSTPTTAAPLPRTGSDSRTLAGVAFGLVALGGGIVMTTKRRREHAAS